MLKVKRTKTEHAILSERTKTNRGAFNMHTPTATRAHSATPANYSLNATTPAKEEM